MSFHSILFEKNEGSVKKEAIETPTFFVDLNLDQIIDGITEGRDEYRLRPFFCSSLKSIDEIKYRQEIFQDLENGNLFKGIKSFSQKMRAMREHLDQAGKLYYKYQKEKWFLDAVKLYCDAVYCLLHDLSSEDIKSRGLLVFREYLLGYINSDHFASLKKETIKVETDLSTINYVIHIKANTVRVRKYKSEIDYSADVEKTFEKFKHSAAKDYRIEFLNLPNMNHVEAKILELVAKLYPDIFSGFDAYCKKNDAYLDETISVFDREIQFYVAYLEFLAAFKEAGLKFCYPEVSHQSKEVYNYEGFDLALAKKLIGENSSVVCNDFKLKDNERVFVVSGPNQGGKTTFARTFGQLHYLTSLGCPVPGRQTQLFLFDKLFTHFEREESINNLRGKLQDDLSRIYDILNQATSNSIIIMNEIFTSTTVQDALFLSKKVMEKVLEMDALCVWVTFIDELTSLGEQVVSMVSTVKRENPALRTYKIVRRPADGLSYAIAIAEKYRLTYDHLKERVRS
jgi:DNA mismatch repair ATPase MutS